MSRLLDFLTVEPLRIRSVLRLVLIVLIALLIGQTHVAHWREDVFTAVLVAYTVGSVAWLLYLLRSPVRWWFRYASIFVDVAVVLALCIASGAGTISLYPIFLLLPISAAFLDSPAITAALGLSASIGYLLAWVVYAARDQKVPNSLPGVVYVQVGCLLWLTVAITVLSYTLARRQERVLALLDVRRRLIAESLRADERHSRELSEQLHDGPLQNLLAARLDLDELRENPTVEGFDRLDAALRETVGDLRTTVSTLHPQVLAQVGLSAAVRDLAHRCEERWGMPVGADVDEVGTPESGALIHRAARELLANAHKHSRATHIDVALHRKAGATVLRVTDDGIGFDPDILARRVGEGHIGLASLVVAVESAGGCVDFGAGPHGGSAVTITVGDELQGSSP